MQRRSQNVHHEDGVEVQVGRAGIYWDQIRILGILRKSRKMRLNNITIMEFTAKNLALVDIHCDLPNVLNLKFWEFLWAPW